MNSFLNRQTKRFYPKEISHWRGIESHTRRTLVRIEAYGVVLRPLAQHDLGRVRRWRNQLSVRSMMCHKALISEKAQQLWYAHIRKQNSFYFIIETPFQEPYGLIHLSELNASSRCAQSGLFVGEARFQGSLLIWLASYSLLRFAFEWLHLSRIEACVLIHNRRAQRYNESLGFRRTNTKSLASDRLSYYLTPEAFLCATHRIQTRLDRHTGRMGLKVQFGIEPNK